MTSSSTKAADSAGFSARPADYANGVVWFNTCSSYAHHPNPKMVKREYSGEIDEFAVFCPDLGSVYRVPIEDMPAIRLGSLRVEPARNNQAKGVRLAAAYEIARLDLY